VQELKNVKRHVFNFKKRKIVKQSKKRTVKSAQSVRPLIIKIIEAVLY